MKVTNGIGEINELINGSRGYGSDKEMGEQYNDDHAAEASEAASTCRVPARTVTVWCAFPNTLTKLSGNERDRAGTENGFQIRFKANPKKGGSMGAVNGLN